MQTAVPNETNTVTVRGAGTTHADVVELPNSGAIQTILQEDVSKNPEYAEMLSAIDTVNTYLNTANTITDDVPRAAIISNLLNSIREAVRAMDAYLSKIGSKLSGVSGFFNWSKEQDRAKRDYVTNLRNTAMSNINKLINLNGGSTSATEELKDDDFDETIKGGMMNQVYKYKQGYFKPAKAEGETLNDSERGVADTIGIKFQEDGKNVDPHLHQREIATSRLDKLLGGGVIVNSRMGQIAQNSNLQGQSFHDPVKNYDRKFNAEKGQKGLLMDTAKGEAYSSYNWDSWGLQSDTKEQAAKVSPTILNPMSSQKHMDEALKDYSQQSVKNPNIKYQGDIKRAYGVNVDSIQKRAEQNGASIGKIHVNAKSQAEDQSKQGLTLNAMDPKLQRDMNALFLIDTLSMQTDRHTGNFFIDADENGYKGLTGIDNDLSFGTNNNIFGMEKSNYGGLPEQMLVDKQMADKIKNVTKPQLDLIFGDLLSKEEIDALWERFQMLSKYIDSLDPQNLVSEWNDNTAKAQFENSNGMGVHAGMDYYTRHLMALNMRMPSAISGVY